MNLNKPPKDSGVAVTCLKISLVVNSEIGKAKKLQKGVDQLKEEIKTLTIEINAAKSQVSSTVTKSDKALAKKG
eukprot:4019922-Ditylum_brightwellii.AAC.1